LPYPRNDPRQIKFNLPEGEARRDMGINLVADNNRIWFDNAFHIVVRQLTIACPKEPFLAEVFRAFPGIGNPRHPNAWGALTRVLLIRHILTPAEGLEEKEYVKATSVKSHAHRYRRYLRGPAILRATVP
jgi:hypothetical protein